MNEELTNEVLEAMTKCGEASCSKCTARDFCKGRLSNEIWKIVATALLEERAKPKVWDGAPEDTIQAQITWFTENGGFTGIKTYNRELPKTRARIMAEEIASAKISNEKDLVDIIEQTINTHMKELRGEE